MEPVMLVCVLAVLAAVGLVVSAATLLRKFGRGAEDATPDGTTSGHAGSMLSALFLLVFAIAIVVPWTAADSARQDTYAESRTLVDAYWAASALPAWAARDVQNDLRGYTDLVAGREWGLMEKGHLTTEGWNRLNALRAKVIALPAATSDEKDARTAVLDQIQALSAARDQRAMDVRTKTPVGVLYMTVIAGLVVLVLPFLAGARPRGMTVVPLGVMAGMLAVGVFLAFDISHAFSGALRVKPDAYAAARQQFQQIPESR